jgi:hypothetical protein
MDVMRLGQQLGQRKEILRIASQAILHPVALPSGDAGYSFVSFHTPSY